MSQKDLEEKRKEYGKVPEVYDLDNFDQKGEEPEAKEDLLAKGGKEKSGGSFFGIFSRLTGNKVLFQDDLEPVLAKMRETLMKKNVAAEITDKLCQSVMVSLEGKKLGTFTTVTRTVNDALEEALARILTPKKPIDILQGVAKANEQGRPYSIVFVGVNGVGKSTNLAKVAAYLQSQRLKVCIAGCDTFRSGAIEQLKTHATFLGIPLYERGYNKDAAAVAMDGISRAKREGQNVILIDTAGRMQDNEPLMRALSKLINTNAPDLVLFVGEALVGNDAVDQLTKFNRCLVDLADPATGKPRLIDGIILTKFDTIDDKVGAAISMTYTTGQPIVFVGVGQKYGDLRRLNVKTVIKALLK
jgi:signal recognition particle receptor subunit alpha